MSRASLPPLSFDRVPLTAGLKVIALKNGSHVHAMCWKETGEWRYARVDSDCGAVVFGDVFDVWQMWRWNELPADRERPVKPKGTNWHDAVLVSDRRRGLLRAFEGGGVTRYVFVYYHGDSEYYAEANSPVHFECPGIRPGQPLPVVEDPPAV
jgi:hypothetical protein